MPKVNEVLPTYQGCPVCGRITEKNCYHGASVVPVTMTLAGVIDMCQEYKRVLQVKVNAVEGRIRRYSQLLEKQNKGNKN